MSTTRIHPGHIFNGRYIYQDIVGRGAFGVAFSVKDNNEKEQLKVLKCIEADRFSKEEKEQVEKETKFLRKCKHENVVTMFEHFYGDKHLCIVMEYCEGGDLDTLIKHTKRQEGIIHADKVEKWLFQMLDATAFMHAKRVIHRDLKPANVLLKEGNIKIADFGVSRILLDYELASTVVGTFSYMSPERIIHKRYDDNSDAWSIGCILYEMCCLKRLFNAGQLMTLTRDVCVKTVDLLPEAYSSLQSLFEKLMEKDPKKRMRCADAIKEPIFSFHNRCSTAWISASEPEPVMDYNTSTSSMSTTTRVVDLMGRMLTETAESIENFTITPENVGTMGSEVSARLDRTITNSNAFTTLETSFLRETLHSHENIMLQQMLLDFYQRQNQQ